jgi:hypothetical protein
MLSPIIYYAFLAAVVGYAFLRGSGDARLASAICIAATVATKIAISPVAHRYSSFEFGVFVVDVLTLLGFIYIALRTDRFWPLWVAGFQLTTLVAHVLKAVEIDLMPRAYAVAGRFWVYPIFLIILIGTWRNHQRALGNRFAGSA